MTFSLLLKSRTIMLLIKIEYRQVQNFKFLLFCIASYVLLDETLLFLPQEALCCDCVMCSKEKRKTQNRASTISVNRKSALQKNLVN